MITYIVSLLNNAMETCLEVLPGKEFCMKNLSRNCCPFVLIFFALVWNCFLFQGFRRSSVKYQLEPRALYLHSVMDLWPTCFTRCLLDLFMLYFQTWWLVSVVYLILLFKQVLTHRSGSTAMLSLIYSEILKMLRLWGLLDFDAEIFVPRDLDTLPRGYHKQKSKDSDQAHIMTSQALLVEVTIFSS